MQKQVERGKAPREIERVDKPHQKGGQNHVHFKDGSALNIDGTWKEGEHILTNKEIKFLKGLHLREDVRKYINIPINEKLAQKLVEEYIGG